jgi:hypothetical protein
MQTVDPEEFSKEELFESAQRFKRRYQKLKESMGTDAERERVKLMLVLASDAGRLITTCANGARGFNAVPFDEEVDQLVRSIIQIHKQLLNCRGETVMSEGMSCDE